MLNSEHRDSNLVVMSLPLVSVYLPLICLFGLLSVPQTVLERVFLTGSNRLLIMLLSSQKPPSRATYNWKVHENSVG